MFVLTGGLGVTASFANFAQGEAADCRYEGFKEAAGLGMSEEYWLVGGFKHFLFSPLFGEVNKFD